MAERSNNPSGVDGKSASGTTAEFTLPDRGTDRVNASSDINGIPIESADSEQYTGGRNRDGSSRRKPGRKPGWNRGDTGDKKGSDRKGLPSLDITAGAIKGVHDLSSVLLHCEELELDDAEAEKIASALIALAKYYPEVDVPGKYIAWFNLLTTMGKVYMPKVATYKIRKKNEKSAAKRQSGNITVQWPDSKAI